MRKQKRLAVITTHPIQYHVPLFPLLKEQGFQIKVFYTWEQSRSGKIYDAGFGKKIEWDIPLLEGYDHRFVKNVSPLPGTTHFWGLINPGLIAEIETWNAECLLIIGWNYHSHFKCMRYFKNKIPIFFRGDSVLLFEKRGMKKLARRIFLTWVYRYVDYAFYVGTHNKFYFLKHGLRLNQLIYSPHAVDYDRFSQPTERCIQYVKDWKRTRSIPSNHITVLYAGKMAPAKNPAFILALAKACENMPVSFIMVGDGHLKQDILRKSASSRQIHHLDFQNQSVMPAVYRLGDVYIMPSKSETWGMGVNEAMACGRPVMVSNKVGCGIDLAKKNRTGIIFNVDDVDTCVNFLKELCHNRHRMLEMGANASLLMQSFTFSQTIDSMARAIEKIDDGNTDALSDQYVAALHRRDYQLK